ncbi:solute carrier family 22 member 7-like [Amblyomma americanum]
MEAASAVPATEASATDPGDGRTDDVADVYDAIGHGAFQRHVLLFGVLASLVLLSHTLSYRLVARPVDHWCRPPADLAELPAGAWKNAAIPLLADGTFSQCTVYDPPIPDIVSSERHEVPCDDWQYDTASRDESIISEWDLVCSRAWMVPLSLAVYMCGGLLCVPVSGIAADRWGRKPVVNASVATLLLAGLGCAWATSYSLFVTSRFVVSGAISSATIVAFILLYEVTGAKRRVLFAVVYTAFGPVFYPVVYRLISLYRLNRKTTYMVLILPASLLVCGHYLIEESPSWLLARWKTRAAEEVVLLAAAANGIPAEKTQRAFRLVRERLRKEDQARESTLVLSPSTFVRKAVLRRDSLSVMLCWFTTFFVFYGINFRRMYTESFAEEQTFLALQITFLGAAYWSMRRWGQRDTLCALICLVCALSAARGILRPSVSAVDVAGVIRRALATLVLCVCHTHTAEVFPTRVRSMGMCMSYAFGRVGALSASFVVHSSGPTWDSVLAAVGFATWCVLLLTRDASKISFSRSPPVAVTTEEPGGHRAAQSKAEEPPKMLRKTSVVSFSIADVKGIAK